jgi:hypothetical protein
MTDCGRVSTGGQTLDDQIADEGSGERRSTARSRAEQRRGGRLLQASRPESPAPVVTHLLASDVRSDGLAIGLSAAEVPCWDGRFIQCRLANSAMLGQFRSVESQG